jgi:hypothetical protein
MITERQLKRWEAAQTSTTTALASGGYPIGLLLSRALHSSSNLQRCLFLSPDDKEEERTPKIIGMEFLSNIQARREERRGNAYAD